MKILLVANTGWYLHNFRLALVDQLIADGCEVGLVCPPDEYADRFAERGIRVLPWIIDRAGRAPLAEVSAVRQLRRHYAAERPDAVHHFTMKPVLYGTLAARRCGIRTIVNNITGLGHLFISPKLSNRLIRHPMRRWLQQSLAGPDVRPVFQAAEDYHELATDAIADRASLVCGSGVDTAAIQPQRDAGGESFPVLFVGRLLREKGICEFVDAASQLRQRGFAHPIRVAGEADPGNPSSIDAATLAEWRSRGDIEFLGHVANMPALLADTACVVQPSYREGTSRVLLEAAAAGLPAIATDVPGCRDVVTDGVTGLLVPPQDAAAIAGAVQTLEADRDRAAQLGAAARQRAEQTFDQRRVVRTLRRLQDDAVVRNRQPDWQRAGRGVFTLSLDFELAWGTRNRPAAAAVQTAIDGTRDAIAMLLDSMERHGVPATWATVGAMLLSGSRRAMLDDAFGDEFADVPRGDSRSQPRWYADDILEQLLDCDVPQEIGCHTLTHAFVDRSAAGRKRLETELRLFAALWQDLGLPAARSFIFPKAHMGHFGLLAEAGYTAVRGPEPGWFERLPGRVMPAAVRLADAKAAIRPHTGRPELVVGGLWSVPSSQFYSPRYSVGARVSVDQRVRKAIAGLRRAAGTGTVFHLWTHPFNLGEATAELVGGLDRIFAEAARLRDAGQLDIRPMGAVMDDASVRTRPQPNTATGAAAAGPVSVALQD